MYVSRAQLRRPDFVDAFLAIASEFPDGDYWLDVELTESVFEDPQCLAKLRSAGVRIAIDEFGAGYWSLARFSALPVDTWKIDRSFTSRVVDDPCAADVVSMVVGLAHRFGATTVAEGVETRAQFERLRGSAGTARRDPCARCRWPPPTSSRCCATWPTSRPRSRFPRPRADARRGRRIARRSLIACIGYVTAGARILRSPSAPPPKLRPIALATPGNGSSRACNAGGRTRFVQTQESTQVAAKLKQSALLACFYDIDGRRSGSPNLDALSGRRLEALPSAASTPE